MLSTLLFAISVSLILGFVVGVIACAKHLKHRRGFLLLQKKEYRVVVLPDTKVLQGELRLRYGTSDIFPVRTARIGFMSVVLMDDGTVFVIMSSKLPIQIKQMEIHVCRQPQYSAYRFVLDLKKAGQKILEPPHLGDYIPKELFFKWEGDIKAKPRGFRRGQIFLDPQDVFFWVVRCDEIAPPVRIFCELGTAEAMFREFPKDQKLEELLTSMGIQIK